MTDESPLPIVDRHPTIQRCVDLDRRLAFRRYINSPEIRKILGIEHGYCRLCGKKCPPRRSSWCGSDCRQESLVYTMPAVAARLVWKRDKVCVVCGKPGGEVDHIVPVSLGGGLCSLNGLRLLCSVHHNIETKKLRQILAGRRTDAA